MTVEAIARKPIRIIRRKDLEWLNLVEHVVGMYLADATNTTDLDIRAGNIHRLVSKRARLGCGRVE